MLAATDRLDFVPPPTPGALRSLALAILAHAFLVAALTWGMHWRREAVSVTAEAELWSEVPQQAAPKPIEAPPEPPAPVAEPSPPPVRAEPPLPSDADIALAKEKLRLKKEQQLEQERQRQAQLKQEKLLLEKQRLQEKREKEKQAAQEKKKADLEKRRKEALQTQQEAQKLEAQRQANIKRMTGLAGASGAATSTGTALQSSGPSASYAGRVSGRIKPNIVFVDEIAGNPIAEVDVRAAPNGTIISRKLSKSSGVKSWDDAVLKAIDKTEKLPPDVDGRVPSSLIIGFRPKE
ncbi:MAG: cell envelope integrity protein TolA [Rhodoferax sp.]|uniref:cell envelope integrity protein TolA n=1 Tax=Rhodoferax sp. TaxID=50421 RepID=UPI00261730EB|nr:cell envelope integrity protein TolA [Rhodoferax sp.]MDD5336783.1 cell envelope integrity protein TolA [Rhodoferax sp.]